MHFSGFESLKFMTSSGIDAWFLREEFEFHAPYSLEGFLHDRE